MTDCAYTLCVKQTTKRLGRGALAPNLTVAPLHARYIALMKAMIGIISIFTIVVIGALYFLLGGPIPQSITYEGEIGTPFQGQYSVGDNEPVTFRSGGGPLSPSGVTFSSQYPHTVWFWAPRRAGHKGFSSTVD